MTCHSDIFDEGYIHPVDMRPVKTTIPIDMPLDSSGKITCNTCHDVHSNYETPMGTRSFFLRRLETGKRFCDICHNYNSHKLSGHEILFRKAHTHPEHKDQRTDVGIDEISRNCLSCHDGTLGKSVMLRAANWRHKVSLLKYDNGAKHPIGMNYERVRRMNRKSMLKPIGEVDKRIRFFNKGCLGCATCHNPYSTKEKKLVIPVAGEALCFSCHKL